jgi:maltooligosyltrehalose trehalohydrolase
MNGSSPAGPAIVNRRYPIGAEVQPGRGTHFRVWAPASPAVAVELTTSDNSMREIPLQPEAGGYFSGFVDEARLGMRYRLRLASGSYPDPASRFQPDGPHGPSQIVDPQGYPWKDAGWRGLPPHEQVLYEMHIGTFTHDGTWRAAMAELPELRRIGITTLEVMPIADFPGGFGWGYDGVDFFAPTRLYGSPDDVRAFVDHAHELGLMVILDVVYNHLGPDGNYLGQFSSDYVSSTRTSEWGQTLNFDGPDSGPVREFFVTNARYWIEEFHFDGLRLDATQQMFDDSERHIIGDVVEAARAAGAGRTIYIVGENEPQHAQAARARAQGGHGLDALWNDDFHHSARVAATGRAEAYYAGYRGTAQEIVSAIKYGFLFQGQWFTWQRKRRGRPALDLSPHQFVLFLQNHDQVANSLRGQRLHELTSPGQLRALTAVLLLAPQTPMLFQGQEFAASAPFVYFADHKPDLRARVSAGRGEFLRQFRSIATVRHEAPIPDPAAREVFERCRLDFSERIKHRATYLLHEDLLRIRCSDTSIARPTRIDGAVLGSAAFVIRYFSKAGDDRLLAVNLGRDLLLEPAPEPLLAPPERFRWLTLWSSESPRYDGCGAGEVETTHGWMLPAHSAALLGPGEGDIPDLHAHASN